MDVPIDPELLDNDVVDVSDGSSEEEWSGSDANFVRDDEDDDDDEDDSDGAEDETDAEDEYRGVKLEKGKGRAVDQDDNSDFNRLLSAYNVGGVQTQDSRAAFESALGTQMREDLEDLEDDLGLLDVSGPRRKRRRAFKGRAPVGLQQPSYEVRDLLGKANERYIARDLEAAKEYLNEVVRIEPALYQSWNLYAMIAEEENDIEQFLSFKIMAAHLTTRDQALREWTAIGQQSRELGYVQQAIYCFGQALRLDRTDVDSMWDRAILLKMTGAIRTAIRQFLAILDIHPHDPGVLREVIPLLLEDRQYAQAADLLGKSLSYHIKKVKNPREFEDPSDPENPTIFSYNDLALLADTYETLKQPAKSISAIKRGVRWLQGRSSEREWDGIDDDREYDLQRRQRDDWQGYAELEALEDRPTYELAIPLRLRLGIARLMNKDVEEGLRHLAIVTDTAEEHDVASLTRCGDALLKFKRWEEAYDAYVRVCENEDANAPAVWIKMAQCQINFRELDGAEETLQATLQEDPTMSRAALLMARISEERGQTATALEWLTKVLALRRAEFEREEAQIQRDLQATGGTTAETRSQASRQRRAQLRERMFASENERQQEFALAYATIQDIEPNLDDPNDIQSRVTWLDLTTELIDTFRETRALYPTDFRKKYEGPEARRWNRKGADEDDIDVEIAALQSRLRRNMADDDDDVMNEDAQDSFRGIHFDDWLRLVIKYAFVLTQNDEHDAAQDTLMSVALASVFRQGSQRPNALRLARAACYLYVGEVAEAVSMSRAIWLSYPYQSDSVRLFLSIMGSGPAAVDVFVNNATNKFVSRQMRHVNDIAGGKEVTLSRTGQPMVRDGDNAGQGTADLNDEERREVLRNFWLPTKRSPFHTGAYGAQMLASRSYIPAIIYLLEAVELLPTAPLFHLCLAVAYQGRSQTRQSDNIQHQFLQGLGWLSQYRDLRKARNPQEVEYNFGRFFHHMGLHSHAVEHYQRCLKLADETRRATGFYSQSQIKAEDGIEIKEPNDFARDAAYNLVQIYMTTGNRLLAREVSHKWLRF